MRIVSQSSVPGDSARSLYFDGETENVCSATPTGLQMWDWRNGACTLSVDMKWGNVTDMVIHERTQVCA